LPSLSTRNSRTAVTTAACTPVCEQYMRSPALKACSSTFALKRHKQTQNSVEKPFRSWTTQNYINA
jgi:hypothetical protein